MTAVNPSKIQAIDKTSVHRICSGQVVLSLAVAVKELMENSLDAEATLVNVRLKEYGSELLEVSDNGTGVHPDNFQALTLKHHTSKLKDFSQLESVSTFGFRGEALSSLCALSKVTISTRHSSQDVGTLLTFDHTGAIISSNHIPRQIGTTVSLTNLFSTLPVRQKEFQRNLKKEFNKMTQLINAYCLVSTNVKITCTNQTSKGSKTTFVSTSGSQTVKENISSVFGPKQLSNLLEIKTVLPNSGVLEELKVEPSVANMFSLEGFISSCAHGSGRPSPDRQFYYINSRPCQPNKVMKAVNEVYHQYNVHQTPFVYMNVLVDRTSVDVNVTPDKRQVFLDQEKLLIATVKSSLTELYQKIPSTYTVNSLKRSLHVSPAKEKSDGRPSFDKLSLFSHKSDVGKTQSRHNSPPPVQKPKQMKLEKHFNLIPKVEKIIANKTSELSLKCCDDLDGSVESTSGRDDAKTGEETLQHLPINLSVNQTKNEGTSLTHLPVNNISELESNKDLNYYENDNNSRTNEDGDCNIGLHDSKSINYPINVKLSDSCDKVRENIDERLGCSSHPMNDDSTIDIETGGDDTHEEFITTDCADKIPDRKTVVTDFNIERLREGTAMNRQSSNDENKASIRFRTAIDPTKNTQAEQELSKEISKEMFEMMEIVGQFNLGFIITKLGSDLFIVDQHATDEKYNFETLQQTTTLSNQKLVVPQNLELTAANECLLLENLDVFKKNGFDFQIDENAVASQRVKLSALPMSKNWIFGKEDVEELLFMLQDVSPGSMCRPSRVRSMFASRACRMSVMIGSHLSFKDMRRLIDHMGQIEQPWNCPHGRPTMRHLINLDLTE